MKALPDEVMVVGGADTGCQIASILTTSASPSGSSSSGPPGANCRPQRFRGTARGVRGPGDHDRHRRRVELGRAANGSSCGTSVTDRPRRLVGGRVRRRRLARQPRRARVGGGRHHPRRHRDSGRWLPAYQRRGCLRRRRCQRPLQTGADRRLEGRTPGGTPSAGRPAGPRTRSCRAQLHRPEYGAVGLTEPQAARDHDVVIGIARYDDLLRPVADGHPDGFCKLIADRSSHAFSALMSSASTPPRSFRSSPRR